MEVVNPRAALLSNYEVLSLLRELESENLLRTKAALRIKREEETGIGTGGSLPLGGNPHLEASENLRTIEVEAIGYLSAEYLPTANQTEEGISRLVKSLASCNLTKAEKLQIVNLAPTIPVELYVIVEELEDRFGDQLDDILENIRSSTTSARETAQTNGINGQVEHSADTVQVIQDGQWDEDADAIYEEDIYDDTGAGNGVEGDLEMDED
ncbi:hypothetical protein HYPSUDRAFT_39128 [Hypholoma sublateritium FD-334 SS-4]|uniref:DNA-directed RNA polymerase III subunit RPC9 n=1 Tax=Hypholoma sublateritium (strain FD-334 SS-4) TaxID=945553 RepID=A0A0D2L9U3_HYPSF|nr:hypothetical protein HYPSUDRAFT_39128 [Hypholoma sublateritium FD-334 SS-4]